MNLIDTNVISELVRPRPEKAVERFLLERLQDELFTAAICLAEIRYGLARMAAGRRRDELTTRVAVLLADGFEGRIVPFDAAALRSTARSAPNARREASGLRLRTP